MANVSVSFKIKNKAQIRRAFRKSPRIMSSELSRAIRKAALFVHRESALRTPVDTGRLRASHRTNFGGTGLRFRGEVSTNTDYDLFVHEGTRFMKARPYMRQAVEDNERHLDLIFTDATQSALNRIARMT